MNRRTLLKSLFAAPLVPAVALGKGKKACASAPTKAELQAHVATHDRLNKKITADEAVAMLMPKWESALPARKTISLDELDRAAIGLWDKMGRTATRFTVRTTRVLSHELLRQVEAANRRIPVTDALTCLPWYYLTLPNYVAAQVRILPDSMMPPKRYDITLEAEKENADA